MNITQPVLSRHMKTLEEHFGAELFKRDTHVVDLTSSGHLLLDEARKIILQYENSLDVMSKFTGKSKKKLKIAFLGEAVQQVLVDFLAEFNVFQVRGRVRNEVNLDPVFMLNRAQALLIF